MVGHLKSRWFMVRVSVLGWRLVGAVVLVIVAAALVAALPVGNVKAASPSIMEDCTACHLATVPIPGIERPQLLKGHDKLGSGNGACTVCHDKDNQHLGKFRLVDGTQIPLLDSIRLCGQCHQKRRDQWLEGTHGVPQWSEGVPGMGVAQNKTAWPAGQYNVGQNNTAPLLDAILKVVPGFLGGAKKICTDCHDPHHPQIELQSVIKPHPVAAPSPPSPPVTPFVVLGGALLLTIGVGAVMGRKEGKS